MRSTEHFISEALATGACDHVLKEIEQRAAEDFVAEMAHHLYKRVFDSLRSLTVLSTADHDWALDGVSIIRAVYDATIQLLWILHDPARRKQRAAMYHDYFPVEQMRMLVHIGNSSTDLAASMAKNSEAAKVYEDVKGRLARFGIQFLTSKGRTRHQEQGDDVLWNPGLYRSTWYPSTAYVLAREVGCLREHRIVQNMGSGAVHSSYLSILGAEPNAKFVRYMGVRFCLRAAGSIVAAFSIALTDQQAEAIAHGQANIFDYGKAQDESQDRP